MKSRFPLYIVSKGRWDRTYTVKALEHMGQPFHIVVEAQERDLYAATVDPKKILVLDTRYQDEYDTLDDLGTKKSKGPGPARNFVWDHAIKSGAKWHWVMDDNIRSFRRLIRNKKLQVVGGAFFRAMEDFVLRYENIAMAGPQYTMFAPTNNKHYPFIMNTRIYSCNLIRNDLPYRWRGRYNEDTDLSLRMLKDGWCTVQFNAFLQEKLPTQTVKGGNTKEFYAKEGTRAKSLMLCKTHPDVATMKFRFGRIHHFVDYRPFEKNKLIRRKGVKVREGVNEYGLVLRAKKK